MHGNWTAACLADDLPPATVLHATCGAAELAVWRSATGRVAAWRDRCPHRGMRLSHGFVRGETLNCIYHGWTYGADGACRRIPAHPEVVPPATIRAEAFSARDAGGIVWVAPDGSPGAPPDLSGLQPVRWMGANAPMAALDRLLGPGFTPMGGALRHGHIGAGGKGQKIALLVQARGPDLLTLIGLSEAGAGPDDRVAISRWLEDLRRSLEAGATP